MSFKFKKATLANTHYITGSLIMPLVLSYGVARWVSGPFYVGVHRNKTMFPIMGLICYWDFWRRMQRPINRRLYTEMLSDETEDGTYLRSQLKEKCPNLWSSVSKQMYELNYRFPEMLEMHEQMPTAILE